jgi:hypothetical protein
MTDASGIAPSPPGSLRAISGGAAWRPAHTSGRARQRWRRGRGRSVSGEPPSRCGRWGSATPGRRFSIAAITVPAIRNVGITQGRNNACYRLMRHPLDRRGSARARTGGPEVPAHCAGSTDTDRPRRPATRTVPAGLRTSRKRHSDWLHGAVLAPRGTTRLRGRGRPGARVPVRTVRPVGFARRQTVT